MITYDVLRHAHAPRIPGIYANWEADSMYRNLGPNGVGQALALGRQYRAEEAKIILALHSPAPRTLYTLAISTAHTDLPLIQIDELFTPQGPDADILNPAFEQFNHRIELYVANPTLLDTLVRFGQNAARAIRSAQEKLAGGVTDGIVLIANHGITGNFVAWALANQSESARRVCLETSLGEAERLRVTGEGVEHIPLRY